MKIEISKLPKLMSKHIFELTEDELNSLAFILDVEVSKFKKTEHVISFCIKNSLSIAYVQCSKNSNISMGQSNKVRNGLSGLTSWGGVFSFADMMVTFRIFISRGYEFTMRSPEKLKVYSLEEWEPIAIYAFDEVFCTKSKG